MPVGRKILVASEDPKIQARREKARAAYAKKKIITSSAAPTVPIPSATRPVVSSKEAKAKSVIAGAVKNKIARKVLENKKERKARKTENNFEVNIVLPMREIELYFAQYPRHLNLIKNIQKNNNEVELIYKPYLLYDYFTYIYKNTIGKLTQYSFKIISDADIQYSSYLYDTFYFPALESHNRKYPNDKVPYQSPSGVPPPELKESNEIEVNKPRISSSSSSSRSSMPSSSSSSRSSMPSSSSSRSSMPSSSSSSRSSMSSSSSSNSTSREKRLFSVGESKNIFNKYKYSLGSSS